jgi:hypothetical protein
MICAFCGEPKSNCACPGRLKTKVIETPYGDITLLPLSEESMEELKKMMLDDPELDLELCDPIPDIGR